MRLRARAPALWLRSVESVSLSESVLGAGGAKGLRSASCPIIFFPLPLSRPTFLFTPLPPSLAQLWRSRPRPLSPRPSPRRPPGPSPPRLAAAVAQEPAPPWGRRAAAPPVRVRRAGDPALGRGRTESGGRQITLPTGGSSPWGPASANGLRGRGV